MKKFFFIFIVAIILFSIVESTHASEQLGASLYITPPHENPAVDRNFTLAIKVDSLAQPINAVSGFLRYDNNKIEIINTSKIGSIFNLWVEEPNFSNIEGTLKFQGGVPTPGFIGNGGTVLLVIFKAKVAGITTFLWEKGEVLASDGKGTNILSDLQNLSFVVERNRFLEENAPQDQRERGLTTNQILIIIFMAGCFLLYFAKLLMEHHNLEVHHEPVEEAHLHEEQHAADVHHERKHKGKT